MKYFRQIEQGEVTEGDLAFHDDDRILKTHRVRIDKYQLTTKGLDAAKSNHYVGLFGAVFEKGKAQ